MRYGVEMVMIDCPREIHLRQDTAQSYACRVYSAINIVLLLSRVIMGWEERVD